MVLLFITAAISLDLGLFQGFCLPDSVNLSPIRYFMGRAATRLAEYWKEDERRGWNGRKIHRKEKKGRKGTASAICSAWPIL